MRKELVRLRATAKERRAWMAAAKRDGVSFSEWVRRALTEALAKVAS